MWWTYLVAGAIGFAIGIASVIVVGLIACLKIDKE